MTTIQALSLDYIVAFHPLFLIIICIQLHARGYTPLIYLWKPFHKYCACVSQRWSPSESLVHTFAAFLLLSYSKILFVSFNVLYHSEIIQDSSGEKTGSLVLYYNATVPYFSTEHAPTIYTTRSFCISHLHSSASTDSLAVPNQSLPEVHWLLWHKVACS